jgi:hypothetical protein
VPPAGQAGPSWNDYDLRRFSAGLLLLSTRRYNKKRTKRSFKPMYTEPHVICDNGSRTNKKQHEI